MQQSPQPSIKLEVAAGVVVRDILDHAAQNLHVGGQQTALHIVGEEIAENATEVLVTRIAQERAAVGQHAHKTREQAKHREGVHLTDHAIHLVVEPPARTKLYLTGFATLEVAEHRGDDFVGTGVECIENGTRELTLHIQAIQEVGHGLGGVELADGVETGVRTELTVHGRVVVADGSVVELLCPVGVGIHLGHHAEEAVLILAHLIG